MKSSILYIKDLVDTDISCMKNLVDTDISRIKIWWIPTFHA